MGGCAPGNRHATEQVRAIHSFRQQGAILQTGPPDERHRLHRAARQVAAQPPVQILVQEDFHSDGLQQSLGRFLKHGNDLLPLDAGKSLKKIVNRVARFQVFEQTLHRHSCADKDRPTAEDLGV